MNQFKYLVIAAICVPVFFAGCNDSSNKSPVTINDTAHTPTLNVPSFDADTAYYYIWDMMEFGPRTPGSVAQQKSSAWMQQALKKVCDTVYRQEVKVTGGDGKSLPCINLIGVINPGAAKRVLLLTHWDSRPWGDQDSKDKDKPILAADDGGSGVGVLLELARQLKLNNFPKDLGIDILFTDVEDYGRPEWGEESYCLGTQYWARHPHVSGYKASYGILLDMVGAHAAQFPQEGSSLQFAGDVEEKVWKAAATAGYSSFFPYLAGPDITDDHIPVNLIAGIKTIDIIHLTSDPTKPFPAHWHTHYDVMAVIDKATLKAVGQTLLQTLYQEQAGAM